MKNCAQARAELAALVYGELPPPEAQAVRAHLESCPACRTEHEALRQVRGLLDAAPPPATRVDLARLYEEAARRQERRLRRWRRVAVGALVAAALLLGVVGLRLEIRLDEHQLVLRWGTPPEAPAPQPQPPAPKPEAPPPPPQLADVQRAFDLLHLLASDIDFCDDQQRQAVQEQQRRLDAFEKEAQERWLGLQRDVRGLYALFTTSALAREKGE